MDISEYEFQEALDAIVFSPNDGRSWHCDIWQNEEAPSKSIIREGKLEGANLKSYLLDVPPGAVAGTRLILTIQREKSYNDVSWSRDDFVDIVTSFNLPRRTPQVVASRSPVSRAEFGRSKHECSYIFQSGPNVVPTWILSASWNSRTNTTHALATIVRFGGDTERDISQLTRTVVEALKQAGSSAAIQPFLIPLPLFELSVSDLCIAELRLGHSVDALEFGAGNSPFNSEATGKHNSPDLSQLLSQLNPLSATTAVQEKNCHVLKTSLLDLRSGVAQFAERDSSLTIRKPDKDELLSKIDVLINILDHKRLYLQCLQKRCEVLLSYVYNALVLKDSQLNIEVARDSRLIALAAGRDSLAMKTVAVLTMLFLPGTFIASIFAMPMFDWDARDLGQITGPRFGIYWAVTIPTTLMVVCVWTSWTKFVMGTHKRENKAAAETV